MAEFPDRSPQERPSVRLIEERLDRFSVLTLGYDRSDPGAVKPAILLEWVREQQATETGRKKRLGAIVTAIITAILGAITWPVIHYLLNLQ